MKQPPSKLPAKQPNTPYKGAAPRSSGADSAKPPTERKSSAREVFARNLRRTRRMKDMSQEELADLAEMSRSYVSGIERGVRNVSIDNMGILADTLKVSLMDLVNPALYPQLDKT